MSEKDILSISLYLIHIGISRGTASAPAEPLEILVLTSSDAIFLWSNDIQKYLRCYMRHSIPLQKIYWSGKNVLLLSSDGCLYLGHLKKQSIDLAAVHESTEEFVEQKSNRRLDICEQTRCEITTKRILNIDRVTDVSVDQCGESFVILQVRAYARGVYFERNSFMFGIFRFAGKFEKILNDASVTRRSNYIQIVADGNH